MILQVAADAPLLIRSGAAGLLILHVGGAATGLISGWVSIIARKGGRVHRAAGDVFCVAMLVMAVIGGSVAPFLPAARWSNVSAAIFTVYLVATAWATVRRPPGEVGRLERVALVVAVALAAFGAAGVAGLRLDGLAADPSVYLFASLAGLAAVCDLRMIARGGLAGRPRLARHIWRISAALVLVTASFFLGQQKFLPAPIRGTFLPAAPVLAALGLLAFWMIRTRFPRRAAAAVADTHLSQAGAA